MDLINKSGKFMDMPVVSQLDSFVTALFHKIPNLTFEANKSKYFGQEAKELINSVEVYSGNQKLGDVVYAYKYVQSQGTHVPVYAITSPRVRKQRGMNKHTKYTKDIKAAVNAAKELLVPSSKNSVAIGMITAFKESFNYTSYHGCQGFKNYANKFNETAFFYAVDVISGNNPPIPPTILTTVQSASFKEAHDTYRILKSLEQAFNDNSGVIARVERDGTISVAELVSQSMTMEVKSTYDLPKNYQEKFTILKVMDKATPIEHVGIKLEANINSVPCILYYMVGGDMVVTH